MAEYGTVALLSEAEATYALDPVPSNTVDGIISRNTRIMPIEAEVIDRALDLNFFGRSPILLADVRSRLQFEVEMTGRSAAGVAPPWMHLVRAGGAGATVNAGVSVVIAPAQVNILSLTHYMYVGEVLHKLGGSRGDWSLVFEAGKVPYFEFDFLGLYSTPTDAAVPALTYPNSWRDPVVCSPVNTPTFTLGGVAMPLRSLRLRQGSTVTPRFLMGDPARVRITERKPSVEMVVETVAMSAFNPWTKAVAGDRLAMQLVHGTTAGSIFTLDVPRLQLEPPELDKQSNVMEWKLKGVPLPAAGNDEWVLTIT